MNAHLRPRWDVAEKKADSLTEPYSTPPIPVREIAEQNGVNVVFADFGKHSEDVAGFCDFGNKRLYVNVKDQIERQNFTMAHELGHWILHREFFLKDPEKYPVLPRFSKPDQSDPYEKEANKFAACLLVPRRLLLPVKDASVVLLARAFGVSRTTMEFRLQDSSVKNG